MLGLRRSQPMGKRVRHMMMVTVMSSPVAEKTGRTIRMPNGTGGARIMGDRCGNHCPLVPLNGGGVGLGLQPYAPS